VLDFEVANKLNTLRQLQNPTNPEGRKDGGREGRKEERKEALSA
jgi:hypothetical protein